MAVKTESVNRSRQKYIMKLARCRDYILTKNAQFGVNVSVSLEKTDGFAVYCKRKKSVSKSDKHKSTCIDKLHTSESCAECDHTVQE